MSTITKLLSRVESGELTADKAADLLATKISERLKPRAREPFKAWGKQGYERRNRVLFKENVDERGGIKVKSTEIRDSGCPKARACYAKWKDTGDYKHLAKGFNHHVAHAKAQMKSKKKPVKESAKKSKVQPLSEDSNFRNLSYRADNYGAAHDHQHPSKPGHVFHFHGKQSKERRDGFADSAEQMGFEVKKLCSKTDDAHCAAHVIAKNHANILA